MAEVDVLRQEARRNTRGRFEQWAKNPTCDANTLSAVHNIRLDKVAEAAGLSPSFGQSPFAITRGNRFEAGLFFEDAERLRHALERRGCLPEGSTGFLDLRLKMNGGSTAKSVDHALRLTEEWLQRLATDRKGYETIVAAPMIRIPKGVILPEALLIIDAVTVRDLGDQLQIAVGEVKVFPDRGGHTDPHQQGDSVKDRRHSDGHDPQDDEVGHEADPSDAEEGRRPLRPQWRAGPLPGMDRGGHPRRRWPGGIRKRSKGWRRWLEFGGR